jgi:hypothetical protein
LTPYAKGRLGLSSTAKPAGPKLDTTAQADKVAKNEAFRWMNRLLWGVIVAAVALAIFFNEA